MSSVSIQPITLEDAVLVQRYGSDPALAATCNVPAPYPHDGGIMFVLISIEARKRRERFPFAIFLDDKFAGVIGLNAPDFEAGTVEVDYWVAVPFWGKGVATQAVAHAARYAFEVLHLEAVLSGCLVENPASARVLGKNGFEEIESVINHGQYGQRFVESTIRRFRLTKAKWKSRPVVK